MIHKYFVLLMAASSCLFWSCRVANTPHSASPLVVAAASDLVKASRPLAKTFQRLYRFQVNFGFGPSGQLEQQIRQGAPFDVYLSAGLSYCQALQQAGFTQGPPKVFALGRLVIWSPSLSLDSLAQLKQERVLRIAIANPRYAPYGVAAQQALQSAGLWEAVQSKLVYAESVSQAFQMAETGNTEAALIARALVQDAPHPFFAIDPSLYEPIQQCAAVLKDAKNPEAARAFLEFLSTAEARRILQDYGFGLP